MSDEFYCSGGEARWTCLLAVSEYAWMGALIMSRHLCMSLLFMCVCVCACACERALHTAIYSYVMCSVALFIFMLSSVPSVMHPEAFSIGHYCPEAWGWECSPFIS